MKLADIHVGDELALTPHRRGQDTVRASRCVKVRVLAIDREHAQRARNRDAVVVQILALRDVYAEDRILIGTRTVGVGDQVHVAPALLSGTWDDAVAVEQTSAASERHLRRRRQALSAHADRLAADLGAEADWPEHDALDQHLHVTFPAVDGAQLAAGLSKLPAAATVNFWDVDLGADRVLDLLAAALVPDRRPPQITVHLDHSDLDHAARALDGAYHQLHRQRQAAVQALVAARPHALTEKRGQLTFTDPVSAHAAQEIVAVLGPALRTEHVTAQVTLDELEAHARAMAA